MARFSAKAALVTGAAQGIGRTITWRLVEEGASVLMFDINPKLAGETARELAAGGAAVAAIGGNVARREDVRRAVERCVELYGGLDVLIAHAGIADFEPLLEISDESWQQMIDVNLTGVFCCTQEAARVMREAGGGAIVITASTNAFWVESNAAHYNASKGGVVAFVRSAALDLAASRIRVNAVDPGLVRTRLTTHVTENPENAADYLKRIPLNRFGEPIDIANAVLFLASDEAAWITGQDIIVDGGQTLGMPLPLPEFVLPTPVKAGAGRGPEYEDPGHLV